VPPDIPTLPSMLAMPAIAPLAVADPAAPVRT
jgi:hypothetical protein